MEISALSHFFLSIPGAVVSRNAVASQTHGSLRTARLKKSKAALEEKQN